MPALEGFTVLAVVLDVVPKSRYPHAGQQKLKRSARFARHRCYFAHGDEVLLIEVDGEGDTHLFGYRACAQTGTPDELEKLLRNVNLDGPL